MYFEWLCLWLLCFWTKPFQNKLMIVLGLIGCALSQRSPYAGSRPPNGYKDKFVPQNTNGTVNSTLPVSVVSLNATQRPPISGVAVVNAEPNFLPILPQDGGNSVSLGNRFGGNSNSVNTNSSGNSRLPYDAHGDSDLVNYLNRQPIDNRPFWLINYKAIEAHRNGSSLYPAGSPSAGSGSFGRKWWEGIYSLFNFCE